MTLPTSKPMPMPPTVSQTRVRIPSETSDGAADDDGDGKLQGQQAGGVVDEALAFEHIHNPGRQADAPAMAVARWRP